MPDEQGNPWTPASAAVWWSKRTQREAEDRFAKWKERHPKIVNEVVTSLKRGHRRKQQLQVEADRELRRLYNLQREVTLEYRVKNHSEHFVDLVTMPDTQQHQERLRQRRVTEQALVQRYFRFVFTLN